MFVPHSRPGFTNTYTSLSIVLVSKDTHTHTQLRVDLATGAVDFNAVGGGCSLAFSVALAEVEVYG